VLWEGVAIFGANYQKMRDNGISLADPIAAYAESVGCYLHSAKPRVIRIDYASKEGGIKMNNARSPANRYVLAAILGGIGGGLLVAIATKAIPKMMSKMMSGMMQNMMGQMRKSGFNPADT
jgi:CheY-specific phosphatase CheX